VLAVPKNAGDFKGDLREILLEIWDIDLCRVESYRNYQCKPFRNVNAVLVCFDVNSMETWCSVKRWVNDIDRFTADSMRILVGCKADYKAYSNLFNKTEKKKCYKPKLLTKQDSLLCTHEIFNIISPYFSLKDLLKLHCVCKWLHNATLQVIKSNDIEDKSQVKEEDVMAFAQSINAHVFYTSAKYQYGINELFLSVLSSIIEKEQQ